MYSGALEPDHGRERRSHHGGDGLHRQALVTGEKYLGLVRDREVYPAGGDLLDRRRWIRGGLRTDVEAGVAEVAAVDRFVETGVVSIHVEVERDVERLRIGGGDVLRLLAA